MECDLGYRLPFNFEPNGILFGSKSKIKLSPRSYPIQCERKWKHSFLSVKKTVRQEKRHRQTYSCPRHWRLSASGGPNWRPPWNPAYITVPCSYNYRLVAEFVDQTYSCPRDWRLSASGGPNWGQPWNPPYISGIVNTIPSHASCVGVRI